MAHTPESWRPGETRHGGRYQLVLDERAAHGFVAEVQAPLINGEIDGAALERRVNLIAAAPEMYTALQEISKQYEDQNINHVDFRVTAKQIVDAAIAKAGQS